MDFRKCLAATIYACSAAFAGAVFAGPNLVANGGFETGDFSGWTTAFDPAYSGIDGLSAHTGSFGAYFGDVASPGSIGQSFATVAGTAYDIDLWLRSDGSTPNSLAVLWNGAPVYASSDLGASSFVQIHLGSSATTSQSTLTLLARNDSGFLELDDISVSAVPEPGTLALFSVALVGTAALRRAKPGAA